MASLPGRRLLFFRVLAVAVCVAACLSFGTAASAAEDGAPCITDVLVSPRSSSVRILIILDKPVKFTYHETTTRSSVIVEIPLAKSSVPLPVIPVGREPIQQVSVKPSAGERPARIEITFSTRAKWQVSSGSNDREIIFEASESHSESAQEAHLQAKPAHPQARTAGDVLECSFKDTDIHDVIQTIAKLVGANIVADGSVQGKITLSLTNIGWEEGLGTALRSLGYSLQKDGSVYSVTKSAPEVAPIVAVDVGRLSVSADQVDVKNLLSVIAEKSGLNIVTAPSVDGKISVHLVGVPVEDGLYTFLSANGYSFQKLQDIYVVDKAEPGKKKPPVRPYKQVAAGKITIDFKDMELSDVLADLAAQTGKNIVTYGQLNEKVTIRLVDVTLEEAIKLVLAGTKYTCRQVDSAFVVGDATNLASPVAQMLTETVVIPLRYIKAEECPKYLSAVVPAANVKPLKEQNSLLVVGTEEMIARIKGEIALIDRVAPQVMIEAQVVEIASSLTKSLGLEYQGAQGALSAKLPGAGQVIYNYGATQAKSLIVTLQALANDGKARVLASPKITTVNGKEANITISQQRYFRTAVVPPYYPDNGNGNGNNNNNNNPPAYYYSYNPYGQVQSVEAGIILRIVPFVGASDEITVDIEPEVSNVTGTGPDGLPEVSRRKASTTVRVKNGETIVIGGLKQSEESKSTTRTPILSSIPIIGELFKSHTKNTREADLVILITPRLILDEESGEAGKEAEPSKGKVQNDTKEKGDVVRSDQEH